MAVIYEATRTQDEREKIRSFTCEIIYELRGCAGLCWVNHGLGHVFCVCPPLDPQSSDRDSAPAGGHFSPAPSQG